MGIFSIVNENSLNLDNIIECKQEVGMESAYAVIAEMEANYNNIMQSIGISELAVFESTGQEMIYETSDVKGFFGKLKEFFLNLLAKVKGIFTKFFSMLDSYIKDDKDFINKYKKKLMEVNMKDFEYQGFEFDINAVKINNAHKNMRTIIDREINEVKSQTEETLRSMLKNVEDESDLIEKLRGSVVGSSSLSAAELSKELFAKLRKGEDSKDTLSNISLSEQLNIISGTKNSKKEAENAFKELNDIIKKEIKALENQEKTIFRDSKDNLSDLVSLKIRCVSARTKFIRHEQSILQVVNGAILTAIKNQNRQAKAICVKALNHRVKNESFEYDDDIDSVIGENFLSGVTLI